MTENFMKILTLNHIYALALDFIHLKYLLIIMKNLKN